MTTPEQHAQRGVKELETAARQMVSTDLGKRLAALHEAVDSSNSEAHILAFIVGRWMSNAENDAAVKELLALTVDQVRVMVGP